MAIPTPPPDASGGFMVIQIAGPVDTHRQRLHVLPFSTSQFNNAGAVSGTDVDGHHNYAYVPTRAAGQEIGINDTFAAYAALLKTFYSANWHISLQALYQTVAGNPTQVPLTPTPSVVAGTNAGADAAGQQRCEYIMYNFRTNFGSRARLELIGSNGVYGLQTPAIVTPTTGMAAAEENLVSYVTGSATAVVGRDNGKFNASAHVVFGVNKRLRRRYGYA